MISTRRYKENIKRIKEFLKLKSNKNVKISVNEITKDSVYERILKEAILDKTDLSFDIISEENNKERSIIAKVTYENLEVFISLNIGFSFLEIHPCDEVIHLLEIRDQFYTYGELDLDYINSNLNDFTISLAKNK